MASFVANVDIFVVDGVVASVLKPVWRCGFTVCRSGAYRTMAPDSPDAM